MRARRSDRAESCNHDGNVLKPLYAAILNALRSDVEGRGASGDRRDASGIRAMLNMAGMPTIQRDEVRKALLDLEREARGLLEVNGDTVLFLSDLETITRKVSSLTGIAGTPNTRGTFKKTITSPGFLTSTRTAYPQTDERRCRHGTAARVPTLSDQGFKTVAVTVFQLQPATAWDQRRGARVRRGS